MFAHLNGAGHETGDLHSFLAARNVKKVVHFVGLGPVAPALSVKESDRHVQKVRMAVDDIVRCLRPHPAALLTTGEANGVQKFSAIAARESKIPTVGVFPESALVRKDGKMDIIPGLMDHKICVGGTDASAQTAATADAFILIDGTAEAAAAFDSHGKPVIHVHIPSKLHMVDAVVDKARIALGHIFDTASAQAV
jgi:hypothetical protein